MIGLIVNGFKESLQQTYFCRCFWYRSWKLMEKRSKLSRRLTLRLGMEIFVGFSLWGDGKVHQLGLAVKLKRSKKVSFKILGLNWALKFCAFALRGKLICLTWVHEVSTFKFSVVSKRGYFFGFYLEKSLSQIENNEFSRLDFTLCYFPFHITIFEITSIITS